MPFRTLFDIFVEDDHVLIVTDVSRVDTAKLDIGVSLKHNSFIMKIKDNDNVFERPLPVTVKDSLTWTINKGVLEVKIVRDN